MSALLELKHITKRFPGVLALDCTAIRGANYCAAGGHHLEHWLNYDPKETERDLDYAQKLGINQIRCFITYQAYQTNPEQFKKNLQHLVHAAGIQRQDQGLILQGLAHGAGLLETQRVAGPDRVLQQVADPAGLGVEGSGHCVDVSS